MATEHLIEHITQSETAVHHVSEHIAEHAAAVHGSGIPEIPNFITLLNTQWHDNPFVSLLHHWENLIFALIVAAVLSVVAWRATKQRLLIPSRGQNFIELLVEGIDSFVKGVIGPAGREHTPFIGTLFLYIWFMNLSVLVPGLKSATAAHYAGGVLSLNTAVALALIVFFYVQSFRIRSLGPAKYLHHLAGSPDFDDIKAAPGLLKPFLLLIKLFVMVLLFCLELLGEFIKPLSLSLRLGFNIFAEDVLLAVLLGLGIAAGFAIHIGGEPFRIGIPFQFLVVPLILIFSTVQALVFSLLSSVYIALMLPHGEHH